MVNGAKSASVPLLCYMSPIARCQCSPLCSSVNPAFSKDSEQRDFFFFFSDFGSLLWFTGSSVSLHQAGREGSTLCCDANRENWSFSDA